MTKSRIIEKLFTGKNFTDCISKMEPAHLQDDLKQEVALIVCEWPEEKVIKLHNDGALEFFVVRVILNQIKSKDSAFVKRYRVSFIELTRKEEAADVEVDYHERLAFESLQDKAIEELNKWQDSKDRWYQYNLIEIYREQGNFRAIEQLTRIPFISCYKTIKKSFNELRNSVTEPAARAGGR